MRATQWGAAILALAGAVAAWAEVPKVKEVEARAPIPVPAGTTTRPVVLRTVKARFETPARRIGELQEGMFCSSRGQVAWQEKLYKLFTAQLTRAMRIELEKAGYAVPTQSDAIFDTPADRERQRATGDQLHVGALIKDVSANFCVRGSETTGGVYMQVFWQLLHVETQKVIFEATTEGTYQPPGAEAHTPAPQFFTRAFAAAARNLLADDRFQQAVLAVPAAASTAGTAMPAAGEILRLGGARPSGEALNRNVTLVRAAVATVSNGSGTGSAFFIGGSYLLSNAHVVGSAKIVKVTLPTGRELVGEVIRIDRARDVALIKTEPAGVPSLPVRGTEANVGEEVYALGSPLGERFNTTLTRGILSGYRTLDDKRYIQSDVAILPGNSGGPLLDSQGTVIGITVMGLGARGIAGMNFFIPIGEALAKLGVEVN